VIPIFAATRSAGAKMSRSPKVVLAACCLTMLAVGENSTAIMAALPAMTAELKLEAATVEWIVNAYLLASAVFIVLGGEAADRFGAARSSAAGIALFALASLVIALAPDGRTVVAARALQGIGAAFAVPGTLAAVTHEHSESDHPRVIGAWTGFLMLGFSIGPLIGGALTHYAGWRAMFWLNLLLMAPPGLALWLRPPAAAARTDRIDWFGLALLAVFMVALVQGLHGAAHLESAPAAVVVPLVLAVVAFVGLVRVETRRGAPLLDLALFRDRNFALACILAFLLMGDIMAMLLYYNIFAQAPHGLGMTPVAAGLSLMPLSAGLFGFARTSHRLAQKIGIRPMMVGGSALLALGCAIAWLALAGAGFAVLMVGLFAAGAGIALPYSSAPRIGLAALPQTLAGKGSGILNSSSFLGGTVGVTAGGVLFGVFGLTGVLALVAISALVGAGLALRLRD
jgi:MFS transporter, DHA2 family, multidrug resistance protein